MAPTLKQIAEATGFSVPTVSQILNRRSGNFCSEESKKAVIAAAEKLGYRQQFADKVKRGEPTGTAAILRRCNTTSEQIDLMVMLMEKFELLGFSAYCISTRPSDDVCAKIRDLISRGVDRFVLLDPVWNVPEIGELYARIEEMIGQAGRTFVGYSPQLSRHVVQDFGPAVHATIRFFRERVGNNFKMLLPVCDSSPRQDALCAEFPELTKAEVLERYRFPLDTVHHSSDFDVIVRHGYERTGELLKEFPETRGFYYLSDQFALGGIRKLVESGLIPGRDVLVAGFNDYPGTRYCGYPVSTAAHDLETLSDLMVRESGYTTPCRIAVPPLIRLRERNMKYEI